MFRHFLDELARRKVIRSLAWYTGFMLATTETVSALFPTLGLAASWQTLVVVVLLAGYPVVFYLSWFYNLRRGRLVRATEEEDGPRMQPLYWGGLLLILVGSAYAGHWAYTRITAQMAAPAVAAVELAPTLAVLPFRDQSPEQDQRWFAEGLAEELTTLLGQQRGLQVAAATSSFASVKQGSDPVAIGKALNVASVLAGSVVVSGDRLKLRVELINAADGKVLWNQSYSRQVKDSFAIQEEIARAVNHQLQDLYLAPDAVVSQARTANADAYVLYLKGREQYRKQTTEAMKEARRFFEQAIGTDPEYTMAYVGLADSIVLLAKGRSKLGILEPDIAAQLAASQLEKAFLRVPQQAEAFAIHGKVLELQAQSDTDALAAYDKALSLNANLSVAHMWRYLALDRLGRKTESLEALERAYLLDPLSVTVQFNRGFELSRRGRFDEARQQYEALIAQTPDSPMGYQGLADAAFQVGQWTLSLQNWKQAMDRSPDNPNFRQAYVGVMLSLGLVEEARPLATDPYFKATLLLRDQQFDALLEDMSFQMKAQPDDAAIAFEAGWYEWLVGDRRKGDALLLQAAEKMTGEEIYALPYCSPAIEFALAHQASGKAGEAQRYRDACAAKLATARQQGLVNQSETYLAARLAALSGDEPAALEALELAFTQGWREWWTARDPLLDAVRESPRAQEVFRKIDAALAQEQQTARVWLATQARTATPASPSP